MTSAQSSSELMEITGRDDTQAPLTWVTWLTFERMLYVVIILVGFGLRAWNLGGQPLSPWEASNTWPAWLAAQGLTVADASMPTSATAYGLQWLLFWLGLDGDVAARVVALVAGTALLTLPWWTRHLIGRETALVLAFLLAQDPWLIRFSRLADGSALAILVAAIAVVVGANVMRHPRGTIAAPHPRIADARVLWVAVGLLAASGPMGLNLMVVLAIGAWWWRSELTHAGCFARRWWLWTSAALLAGATLGLVRLDGLTAIAASVAVWLSQFSGSDPGPLVGWFTDQAHPGWVWLRLVVDTPLTVLFGVIGLAALIVRDAGADSGAIEEKRLGRWLLLWLSWGLVLGILPGRGPLMLPMIGLPLVLATAFWVAPRLRLPQDPYDWREPAAVALTLTILLVSMAFWSAGLFYGQAVDAERLWLVGGGVILGILIVAAFAYWSERELALRLFVAMIGALLLLVNLRGAWHLKQETLETRAGWQVLLTHPDVRDLAADVRGLSWVRTGDPTQLGLVVLLEPYTDAIGHHHAARPDPVLGWYLRHMRALQWGNPWQESAPTDNERAVLVLMPGELTTDAQADFEQAGYIGTTYRVESAWEPGRLFQGERVGDTWLARAWSNTLRPLARWSLYREPVGTAPVRTVTLWATASSGR